MGYSCDRCGIDCRLKNTNFVPCGELIELKLMYQTATVKSLCSKCGRKANLFVNYYGKKLKKDKVSLRRYLASGVVSKVTEGEYFSKLSNAGYY